MAGQTPAEEAWALLWRIMQANKRRMIEMARELDFSPVQLHSLRVLEPGVETPMRALAQQLFCDPSNVTGIVDRLEKRGLVERRVDENDRRVKKLALVKEKATGIAGKAKGAPEGDSFASATTGEPIVETDPPSAPDPETFSRS